MSDAEPYHCAVVRYGTPRCTTNCVRFLHGGRHCGAERTKSPPPRPPRTPAPPLDAERLFTLEDVRRMSGYRPTPETDEDWARFIAELDARGELSHVGERERDFRNALMQIAYDCPCSPATVAFTALRDHRPHGLPPAPGSLPKLPQSAFNLEKKKGTRGQ